MLSLNEPATGELGARRARPELDAIPSFGNFALSINQGSLVFRSRIVYNLRLLPQDQARNAAAKRRMAINFGFFGFDIDSNNLVKLEWMRRDGNLAGCRVRVVHNGKLLGLPISPGSRVFPLSLEEYEIASSNANLTLNES